MAGPDPAVAAVRSAVRGQLQDVPDGALVLVACSGGADSLALAAGTAFVAARVGLRAGAVVVDHGWHSSSAQIALAAADVCRGLGLTPVEIVSVAPADVPPTDVGLTDVLHRVDSSGAPRRASRPGSVHSGQGGPEATARYLRYAALDAAAERLGAVAVLLGHTLDDQAETVLLGLARGSGARSLAGMAARRGRYRRPLLALSRATTVQACSALGLAPWSDPANADPAYARARVRSAMRTLEEALGPGLAEALVRSADQLREDADALDALAAELLRATTVPTAEVTARPAGATLCLDVARLAVGADAVRRRALLLALRQVGCPSGAVGRRHVLAVDALVVAWRGQGATHLPGGVVARRDCGRLLIVPGSTAGRVANRLPERSPDRGPDPGPDRGPDRPGD